MDSPVPAIALGHGQAGRDLMLVLATNGGQVVLGSSQTAPDVKPPWSGRWPAALGNLLALTAAAAALLPTAIALYPRGLDPLAVGPIELEKLFAAAGVVTAIATTFAARGTRVRELLGSAAAVWLGTVVGILLLALARDARMGGLPGSVGEILGGVGLGLAAPLVALRIVFGVGFLDLLARCIIGVGLVAAGTSIAVAPLAAVSGLVVLGTITVGAWWRFRLSWVAFVARAAMPIGIVALVALVGLDNLSIIAGLR